MSSQKTSASTGRALQTVTLLAIFCLILVVLPGSVFATSPTVTIENVTVSNVNDVRFTVSWTTTTLTDGRVRWGTEAGNLSNVINDPAGSTSTHFATLAGLSPNTQYFFVVESAGVIGDDNGVPFSVTTPPTPSSPPPTGTTIFGYAYYDTQPPTPLANVVVFIRIEDNDGSGTPGVSQWLSARTDTNGGWFYTLSGVRTENFGAFFIYSAGSDNLYFWGEGGINGRAGVRPTEDVVPVPEIPTQLPNLIFVPTAVSLVSFDATPGQAGVTLTWATASEISNQGFNLYRADNSAGPQDLLAYVPSQAPGSTQGFAYQWLDEDVVSGETYYYWLEDIDLAGVTTLYGPVSATFQAPTAVDVASFAAQPAGGPTLAPWLLALPALLGGAAYGLRRRARRPSAR